MRELEQAEIAKWFGTKKAAVWQDAKKEFQTFLDSDAKYAELDLLGRSSAYMFSVYKSIAHTLRHQTGYEVTICTRQDAGQKVLAVKEDKV